MPRDDQHEKVWRLEKLTIERSDGSTVDVLDPGIVKGPITGDSGMYFRQLYVLVEIANTQHKILAALQRLEQQGKKG